MESAWPPHWDSSIHECLLQIGHSVSPKMKNGGSQCRIRLACGKNLDEVLEVACSAGGDYRDRHLAGRCSDQLAIKSSAGSIAVHGGQQYLSCASIFRLMRPFNRLFTGWLAPTGHPNF